MRNLSRRVERQGVERLVREGPDPPVEVEDVLSGFRLGGVPIGLRIVFEDLIEDHFVPVWPGPVEGVAEVSGFDIGHMFDYAEEVEPSRRPRPSQLSFAQTLVLPLQRLSRSLREFRSTVFIASSLSMLSLPQSRLDEHSVPLIRPTAAR